MTAGSNITLESICTARDRIAPHVRRTPVIDLAPAELSPPGGPRVTLKLEHMQVGGSFKARGACNKVFALPERAMGDGVVTASGGNHGIGVAYAANRRGVPATVFLPERAPASTESKLAAYGARAVRAGEAWDDAWAAAVDFAARHGALAVHPFEDPDVIAGQGTVGLELAEQVPDADVVLVAIGGGGLAAGVAVAVRAARPGARVFGVEPAGAPSMRESLRAGQVITLEGVHTIAGTLAPRAVGPTTLALAAEHLAGVVLVSDAEMLAAMRALWTDLRVLVEPAGAAAFAALRAGRVPLEGARSLAVLVCGANMDAAVAARALGDEAP